MAKAASGNPIFRAATVVHRNRSVVLPIAAASLLFVILVPLPPVLMDMLLVANITIAALVMLTTIYVTSPLEFSVFPSLLLGTTLLRLVLNVATTRLILTAGEGGRSPDGDALVAAGKIIFVFGNFVAGGSLAVGLIIFIILVVIQFVVITKGATRISEVAARFTLDGMPGKQMAIDADLNAGLINDQQAKARREAISREADFYGAMDGASKFVRGDAIAGIIITLVNIVGGLVVGMIQYDWELSKAAALFTRLTIGDGLVSQIPAFIISISAGLIVTRSTAESNLGEDLLRQLTNRPIAMVIAAVFLGMLALTPLPKVPLLLMGLACATVAYLISRDRKTAAATSAAAVAKSEAGPKREPAKAEEMLGVDPMQLEVGYALVRLVDAGQGGDLLDRITNLRRQMASEMGLLVPPIRIRDNMQLDATRYVIKIRDVEVAQGEVMPGQLLAMDSGAASGKLVGQQTTEPAFGLPAVWINESQKSRAEMLNYTVVEASAVLATHLSEVIRRQGHTLLTREQVNKLLEKLKEKAPNLVDEVVPEQVKPGQLQKVLANLLRERVPIRDLETILETVSDWIGRTGDLDVLTEYVRNALARTICQQYSDAEGKLWCVTLDPQLEDTINAHIERSERGTMISIPPQLARKITQQVAEDLERLAATGHPPVVLCSPPVRMPVRRLLEPTLPNVAVLGYNEIDSVQVESVSMVAGVS